MSDTTSKVLPTAKLTGSPKLTGSLREYAEWRVTNRKPGWKVLSIWIESFDERQDRINEMERSLTKLQAQIDSYRKLQRECEISIIGAALSDG